MRAPLIIALTAVAAIATSPASAKTIEIAPSTPWNVDFGADKCRLTRAFGEGDEQHLVIFDQYEPSATFGMTVAGPAFKRFGSRQRTELSFFAAQPKLRTEPFAGKIDGFGAGVIYPTVHLEHGTGNQEPNDVLFTSLPQLDTQFAQQTRFVSLKQRVNEIRLKTGPLAEAFKVLNECTQGLVNEWGLDAEQHLTATRLPRWSNSEVVVRRIQSIYPQTALYRGEQGIVRMRVVVNEQGRVESCTILKATQTEELESPACKAMKEARFEPALDAQGQPMRSYYATTITYQIN